MNYAILYDLGAVRISFQMFQKALISLDGRISYVKLYGYNAKRHAEYTDFVKKYSAYVDVPLANRKKTRVDIRQVIDATALAVGNKNIDGFFLICSAIDAMPMVRVLKENGKKVVVGVESPNFISQQSDETIIFDRAIEMNASQQEVASDSTQENLKNSLKLNTGDIIDIVEKRNLSAKPKTSIIKNTDKLEKVIAKKKQLPNIPIESEPPKEVSQKSDDEFLPYSGIVGSEQGMSEVKDTLLKMIDKKRSEKSKITNSDGVIALEELLKKYF